MSSGIEDPAHQNGTRNRAEDRNVLSPPSPAAPGMVLGKRYQLVRDVGGTMGHVFQAIDTATGKTVAVKVLRAPGHGDPATHLRSYQEGAVLSTLSHPNIVTVYAAVVEDDWSFLIMEFLEGRPLSRILRTEPVSLERIKHLSQQVARALVYAHGRSIVHRDIKPDNIMVMAHDHVTVTDFGIARVTHPDSLWRTLAGVSFGTPTYMAPEQIEGGDIDGRTDVYALGAVMYEMVTGHPPFEGKDMVTVMHQQLHAAPAPPTQLEAALPPEWEALILQALAKDPAARFQSAQLMEESIAALPVPEGAALTRAKAMSPPGSSRGEASSLDVFDRSETPASEFDTVAIIPLREMLGSGSSAAAAPDQPGATSRPDRQVRQRTPLAILRQQWAVALLALALSAAVTLWAVSREQMSSALHHTEATATAQTLHDRNSLATAVAGPSVTATAQARATAAAQARATAVAAGGGFVFGPASGQLDGDHLTMWAGQDLRDFVARVHFYNPTGMHMAWDYGLMFRNSQRGGQYRLTLTSNREYVLLLHDMSSMMMERVVASGRLPDLHTAPGSSNTLRLEVRGGTAWFWVNDRYIRSLNVSQKLDFGDIGVGTALDRGAQYDGMPIRFADFTVTRFSD